MEEEEKRIWKENIEQEQEPHSSEPPQLVVQQFSMEALHQIMMRNNCQILGMYDEMSVMYGQLDAYKHLGSRLDCSTLLDLYNGGSWCRNFKNKESASTKMRQTSFNMCGFMQPSFMVKMLSNIDPDGFNDRQFFVCSEEVDKKYTDLKVPMDESVPKLDRVLTEVKVAHSKQVEYV